MTPEFRKIANNEKVEMTRRIPDLPHKVLVKDAKIVKKIISAWDVDQDPNKVLSIFLEEKSNLSDQRYWELLRTVWILTGTIENVDIFIRLMSSNRKHQYYFTTPEDAKKLRENPDNFKVYRAADNPDDGISWTTSKEYAIKYQWDFGKAEIFERTVSKKEVFAYIERNLESEIIILP